MPNLKQVAQRAGVSTATVSNVLGGVMRASESTRQRVLAAVRELDYHPDLIAQSLRKRSTRTLGMVIPDIANPFFPQLVRGAEDAAWEEKYILITFNTDEQLDRERVAIALMRARKVDGLLVIAGPHPESKGEIIQAGAAGVPIVVLDRKLEGAPLDSVLVDNRTAARKGVEQMIALGCRRVAFIGGPESLANARERHKGYDDALKKSGRAPEADLVRPGDYHRNSGYREGLALLRMKRHPDGIFAANAMMAIGAMDALKEFPLKQTRAMVVGHFDDIALIPPTPWTIVTVSQPAYEMGHQGAALLLDRITGRSGRERIEVRLNASIRVHNGSTPL